MNQKRQKDEVYEAMLQERIGQTLRDRQREAKLDLQVLESWAEEQRMRKRRQRHRYAMIACCVLLICAGALALRFALPSGSDVSMAEKNGDTVKETDGGAVIKDNQADAAENMGNVKITIDDWEKVYDAQKEYPDMLVPEYVPEGYAFEKLVIEGNALKTEYCFYYRCENEKLSVKQSSEIEAATVYDYNEILQVGAREVFINYEENVAYFEEGNVFVTIKGQADKNEISKMVEKLKRVDGLS